MTSLKVLTQTLLLSFIISFGFLLGIPDEPLNISTLKDELETSFTETHSFGETRELYHNLLNNVDQKMMAMDKMGSSTKERAVTCNALRYKARTIARFSSNRIVDKIMAIALQLRDSYQYGFRFLFSAMQSDVKDFYHNSTSKSKTYLTAKQIRDCLFPSELRLCPSYDFLITVRGKTDKDILVSCTKSNKKADKLFHNIRRTEESKLQNLERKSEHREITNLTTDTSRRKPHDHKRFPKEHTELNNQTATKIFPKEMTW